MDSGSVELARRAFAALSAGELDAMEAVFAPDAVMTTEANFPGGGVHEGREATRRFVTEFREAFEALAFEETREAEQIDGVALLRGRWVGSGRSSGIESVTGTFSVVVVCRDDAIAEMRFFWDDEEAREHIAG